MDGASKSEEPRAHPYHHGDLRAALLTAARRLLAEDGPEDLTLRGVAKAVGVSRQAPYHHFADKSALLAAVATEGFRDLEATARRRMAAEPNPLQRLNASGVGYVVFAAENPALFRLMFGGFGAISDPSAELLKARRAALSLIEDQIDQDNPARARLRAVAAWATVHGIAELLINGALQPSDYGLDSVEALAASLLTGGPEPCAPC